MKMNRMSVVYLVAGVLSVVATLSIFLVNSNQEFAIHIWLGFFAMLYGEVAFFGGMILIEKYAQERNLLILKTGGGIVVGVYALLTFLLSFVYMNVEYASPFTFLSFLAILLVYTLIVESIFVLVSRRVFKKEVRGQAREVVDKYLEELDLIEAQEPYLSRITKLKEKIRIMDPRQAEAIGESFYQTVGELQEQMRVFSSENEMKVNELLATLEQLPDSQNTQ
ncbi:MAG: hypothetical protein PHI41_08370 [Erysipelotrichaceae bacterium]|nr:hypothetical protein [Erysipelotrichaceae bacterium]